MTEIGPAGRGCIWCGEDVPAPGFLEGEDQGGRGYGRWVAGPLERGPLGGARRFGRTKLPVHAWRCPRCGHLELFAIG